MSLWNNTYSLNQSDKDFKKQMLQVITDYWLKVKKFYNQLSKEDQYFPKTLSP